MIYSFHSYLTNGEPVELIPKSSLCNPLLLLGSCLSLDDAFGALAFCVMYRGFDPHTEQIFVWSTDASSCSEQGCVHLKCILYDAEEILERGNIFQIKNKIKQLTVNRLKIS